MGTQEFDFDASFADQHSRWESSKLQAPPARRPGVKQLIIALLREAPQQTANRGNILRSIGASTNYIEICMRQLQDNGTIVRVAKGTYRLAK